MPSADGRSPLTGRSALPAAPDHGGLAGHWGCHCETLREWPARLQVVADDCSTSAQAVGFPADRSAHELSVEDFAAVLNANLLSCFAVTRAFLPAMIARRRGDIFNMSSTAGLQGFADNVAHCAAKFGVTGLTAASSCQFIFDHTDSLIREATNGRARIVKVEIWEKGDNRTAKSFA
jgi:hypothetical protein